MKQSELESIIKGICPAIRQYTDDAVAKLLERIAKLEGRLDEQRSRFDSLERGKEK